MFSINLADIKKVHLTGIKGVGMTSLACILKDLNLEITGSDTSQVFVTDEILVAKKITHISPFSETKIDTIRPDLLIYTAAHHGEENLEVKKAQELSIPVLSFAQAVAFFCQNKKVISVSGVGGKTTTTAMISTILEKLNQKPSYMIGSGKVDPLSFPGAFNQDGEYFISEADEYKSSLYDNHPKFYYLNPQIIVIPNLAYDHPDIYPDENSTINTFKSYIEKLPKNGCLIINLDSPLGQKLLDVSNIKAQIFTYSKKEAVRQKSNQNHFIITNQVLSNQQTGLNLDNYNFNLSCLGEFNVYNATAAILTAKFIGLDYKNINNAICSYCGVKRRFEKVLQKDSTYLFDDYAHHPDEIIKTIDSFRHTFPKHQLIVIFEPHTYSRTKTLFSQFTQAFNKADFTIICDIFSSAREQRDESVTSQKLVEAINKSSVVYAGNKNSAVNFLNSKNLDKTVIITMGAGDIYQIIPQIKNLILSN